MAETILCISIEANDTPALIGEASEFAQMLEMIYGGHDDIPEGETVRVTLLRLTRTALDALPDWGP